MPRFMVQAGPDEFFWWSTIVDAPVTYVMTAEEARADFLFEYGRRAEHDWPRVLERAKQHVLAEIVRGNRAGDKEEELTLEQILARVREKRGA